MKKLLILAMLLPVVSKAQLEITKTEKSFDYSKVKRGGSLIAELTYKVDGADTVFTLLYRNAEYQQLIDFQSVVFNGGKQVLDGLETLLRSVFLEDNKKDKNYEVSFRLGDQDVIVSIIKTWGYISAMFFTHKGYCYLTEKDINKLFLK